MLDASAVLAYLNDEPGAARVLELLERSAISTVNWSETLQKSHAKGVDPTAVVRRLIGMGLQVIAFSAHDAEQAAALWLITKTAGLSLADRCCLALAQRLDVPALTADRTWAELAVDVQVQTLR